jgi:SAM-dependent methyltransferase
MEPAGQERPRYDRIGRGYAELRREDPGLAQLIVEALGPAQSVVNVGAGAGSYEPRGRDVIAIEPSKAMAAQRPPSASHAIQAVAQALPLGDDSVDAAMAVLSLHHWHPDQVLGVREMCRVARGPVVIVTFDPRVSGRMWLMADYLPEVAQMDIEIFPDPQTIATWLGAAEVTAVPIARDTPDWTLGSFWAHPERVLDRSARNTTSGFARMAPDVVDRVVAAVGRDLADGTWDARHGHLRELGAYDVGMRLITRSPDVQD